MNKKSLVLTVSAVAIVCVCAIICVAAIGVFSNDNPGDKNTSSEPTVSIDTSSIESSSETSSSDVVSNPSSSQLPTSSNQESTVSKPNSTTDKPNKNHLFPGYKYNTTLDIEDNVFIDSLVYTGYNLEKHRADGLMWEYVLSKYKKGKGWLSNITFGGGSTGLETKDGLPDIKHFEKGGLVCASFATYVYFNYLPNVAKIDTSCLDVPEKSYSAQSFYLAAQKWVEKGYSYNIGFTANNKGAGIEFIPDEEIPIGSIIVFRDMESPGKKSADHITIYVGEKNGYHWVIQTGNKNGPEFCAVERFKFGPDPQWPLKVFATPNCIYDAIGGQSAQN